jgi:hypothetical protein
MPDVDHIVEVKVLGELLRRSAVTATVMRNDAKPFRHEKKHLCIRSSADSGIRDINNRLSLAAIL